MFFSAPLSFWHNCCSILFSSALLRSSRQFLLFYFEWLLWFGWIELTECALDTISVIPYVQQQSIDINKDILENIVKEILENINEEILENINIDRISNRWEFGISNRANYKMFKNLIYLNYRSWGWVVMELHTWRAANMKFSGTKYICWSFLLLVSTPGFIW